MINTSLDLVPTIRGLESFSVLFVNTHLRWRMNEVRFYVASITVLFLEKEAPGSWNCENELSFGNFSWSRSFREIISGFLIECVDADLVNRNIAILNLVWERQVVRLWMQCLVTWICTYTWTSRWPLFCSMDFLFCDAKSFSKSIECSSCRQQVRLVLTFRSWSVIGLSNSLMLVFGLFVIFILHYITYIYKSLLILFFSYDLVLVFIAKALLFSSVILKSYSQLSNYHQK